MSTDLVFGLTSSMGTTSPSRLKYWDGSAWVSTGSDVGSGSSLPQVRTPTNLFPAPGSMGVSLAPTLVGNSFGSLYNVPQGAAQFQLSASNAFDSLLHDSGTLGAVSSYTPAGYSLPVSTETYWRVRHRDVDDVWSAYSTPTSFVTTSVANSFITTPTATPEAMGDAFEGGFYTGMIWNEVVQTSTSTIVGMGSKTFSVPDMTAAPLVYEGQTLEVRDRTTPTTKMVGTVSAAAGTSITINVTSVSGSGTLSDWSIMARYRLIVAPKATGQSASLAYKNADSAAPAACDSLTEGRKATLAMVAAGNSTVYPAAHFCNSLNIGGFTDWYLPARDELELCWRNLKPITSNNSTGTERPSLGYTNLGSLGDLVTNHGNNRNSSPVGASYSLSDPAQVAAGKNFRVGESEAFTAEARYWASTAVGGAAAAEVYFWTQFPGYQAAISKTRGNAVRAIRRSVI